MTKRSYTLAIALCAIVVLTVCSGAAFAQTTPAADTQSVTYFDGANTSGNPDATVRIDHPGTSSGNLCAMIYVFEPDQQMAECCGCNITPNGLTTLSVNGNLASNALTGVVLNRGTIKVVSSLAASGVCNPTKLAPTAALRAWATHIQSPAGFAPVITETQFLDATLSTTEVTRLQNLCKSIVANGSGHGICTCGTGS